LTLTIIIGVSLGRLSVAEIIKNWEGKISRIEKSSLDDEAVRIVKADFEVNELEIKMTLSKEDVKSGAVAKLSILKSKLNAALDTANARFKSENPMVFSRAGNFFNGMLEGVHQ
jgi:hypothetical protein